ncbi:MAG: hypothetical protein Q9185_001685 [Variospora sp. 1 TL-2023]
MDPTFSHLPSMILSPTAIAEYKRLSLCSTNSALPIIVQGPPSPESSLKANLSFASLMASHSTPSSRKASVAASTGSGRTSRKTTSHFDIYSSADEADPDEEIAANALSDFIESPNDTHTTNRSPAPRRHFRSGSVSIGLPSETASIRTLPSECQEGSTRATKFPRGSASERGSQITSDDIPTQNTRKRSVASGSSADGFPASEAVPTTDYDDSPTLSQFPAPPQTKPRRGKTRDSMLLTRNPLASENVSKGQKGRTATINMEDPEVKAEKGLGISLLPNFLKLPGSRRHSMSTEPKPSRDSMEITEVDEITKKRQDTEQVRSTFESDSSEEDAGQPYDEHAFIGGAKLAASHRPSLVEGRRGDSGRVVSMQEILREAAPEAAVERPQPRGSSVPSDSSSELVQTKVSRVLGETSVKLKRAGIVGLPAVHETSQQAELADGLRSNPVRKIVAAPASKTEVEPVTLSNKPRAAKDSVVLTSYPPGYSGSNVAPEKRVANDDAGIMLVLYSGNSNIPTMRKLTLPQATEVPMLDEDDKRPPFRATIVVDFDDEKLFKLIHKQYTGMRGIAKGLISARAVQGINLLSYHRLSQLAVKEHRPARRKTFRVYDDIFTEERMMDLWHAPGKGRKKFEWVEWVRRLPRYSEGLDSEEENIALELVEGWGVGRVAFAVLVIVLLSMLATLLWVLVGINGSMMLQNEAMVGLPMELRLKSTGFRGAGMRVGTGLALGLLVLLLGWTGVGAWILLSWLVV